MEIIGFIGLGIMGKPMASNLLKAGRKMVIYDIAAAPMEELAAMGADTAGSPAEVAAKADIIITMLPNSPQVREVVTGKNGVMDTVRKGQIIVDMSSIAPLVSRELCALLELNGAEMLDAPVSGGQEKAEKGTLAIMVGGKEEVYNKVKDILDLMGRSNYVAGIGAGQTAKLVNQTIVGINIAAVAEGMSLAKKSGVDPEKVFNAIRGGLAGSQCMEDKAPRMFEGRYNPGFRVNLHIKDLGNVQETSRALHLSMPLVAQVMEMMQNLAAEGHESLDHGALGLFYEKLNGISLKK